MATSAVPLVIDALFAAATAALPTTLVFDGFGLTDDPGDFLMIGVEDPDTEGMAFTADVKQEWAYANTTTRDEDGEITCAALSWNGDGEAKTARDGAYAITAAVETLLRANPSLSVPQLLWAEFGTTSQFSQAQGPGGASALVIFRIHFRARF